MTLNYKSILMTALMLGGINSITFAQPDSEVPKGAPSIFSGGPADISGTWGPIFHEDVITGNFGGETANYLGLPLNDAGRLRAESHSEDMISLIEFQCRSELSVYAAHSLLGRFRITEIREPQSQRLINYHMSIFGGQPVWGERTIYMDGRSHPPAEAPHTFAGFSTGEWNAGTLTVMTTHLKTYYLRRPAVPGSDQRTVTEHFRRHGDYLTVTMIVDDPVFYTEPVVSSQTYKVDLSAPPQMNFYRCHGAPELPSLDGGRVPHYLPGTNPSSSWISEWYGIPEAAALGGAETMYPEYRNQLEQSFSTLERCTRNCGPGIGSFATGVPEEDR